MIGSVDDGENGAGPFAVERHRGGQVVLVTLDRPATLNALCADMMDGLTELWPKLAHDADVRCVGLTGRGRGFCSGTDVGYLSAARAPRAADVAGELSFLPGPALRIPVVVGVNGVCAGAGLHFVADADVVIAARSAYFTDPHVSVGQVSGIEPITLVGRLPLPIVSRLALLGRADRLDATRAYELGLVSELVDDGNVAQRVVELCEAVADNSPAAVAVTRELLRASTADVVRERCQVGWDSVQAFWSHPDSVEGPAAFGAKRPPVWTTR